MRLWVPATGLVCVLFFSILNNSNAGEVVAGPDKEVLLSRLLDDLLQSDENVVSYTEHLLEKSGYNIDNWKIFFESEPNGTVQSDTPPSVDDSTKVVVTFGQFADSLTLDTYVQDFCSTDFDVSWYLHVPDAVSSPIQMAVAHGAIVTLDFNPTNHSPVWSYTSGQHQGSFFRFNLTSIPPVGMPYYTPTFYALIMTRNDDPTPATNNCE